MSDKSEAAATNAMPTSVTPSSESKGAVDEVNALLAGHTGRDDERRILDILSGLEPEPFSETLRLLDLARLLADVDDVAFGVKHHRMLLDLLSQERADDLDGAVKVRFIRALQAGLTRQVHEEAIRNVFIRTSGLALTALKDDLDIGGGHHDLSQLLYSDIDDKEIREEVLEHIKTASPQQQVGRKVLSDVDDTFYANWADTRFPKKTVYPGVRAFYRAVAQRADGAQAGVTFLTARPADRAGIVENRTHSSLQERGLSLATTVLGGDLLHLHSHARIAKKKIENFMRYRLLFPEYSMVFVGDSGQGDADVGRAMLQTSPEHIDGVFIHDVRRADAAERSTFKRDGIHFFDTYLGAALDAHHLGMIASTALLPVYDATKAELAEVAFESDVQRTERQAEFSADAARFANIPPQ